MLKVLMFVSWYENYFSKDKCKGIFHYEYLCALKEKCKVALFFPYDQSITEEFIVNNEDGIITYRSRFDKGNIIKNIVNIMKCGIKAIREFKPDIIHGHVAINAGFYATVLGKTFKIPVIITEHLAVYGMNLQKKRNIIISNYVYKNSNKNVCVSRYQFEELSYRFKRRKFIVIYNGTFNPEKYIKYNEIYKIEKNINVAIVGAFYSKDIKGYQFLLPALKKLVKEIPNIKLHIIGDGKYFSFYKNMAHELEIDDICIFYGNCDRSKTYTIISQVDFCVSASIYESAGVFIQEAMMLGKPMVVTRSGGADSLVYKKAAIVVDTNSVNALYVGIKYMCYNYVNYNSIEIKNYAFKNFEMSCIIKKYNKLYRELIRKKK